MQIAVEYNIFLSLFYCSCLLAYHLTQAAWCPQHQFAHNGVVDVRTSSVIAATIIVYLNSMALLLRAVPAQLWFAQWYLVIAVVRLSYVARRQIYISCSVGSL
eukprot:20784-Heterococcus_DN1.PRE.2